MTLFGFGKVISNSSCHIESAYKANMFLQCYWQSNLMLE